MAPVESGSVVVQRHPPVVEQVDPPVVEQVAQRPSSRPGDHELLPPPDREPTSLAQLLASGPDDPESAGHHVARALAVTTFLAVLVTLGLILLNPDGNPTSALVDRLSTWLESRNVPQRLSAEQTVERLANVALFVPFGLVGMLAWRRRGVLWWSGAGFLVSLAAELAQGRFLPGRTASADDVVSNTAGAFAGAVIAAILLGIAFTVLGLTRMTRRAAERRRLHYA